MPKTFQSRFRRELTDVEIRVGLEGLTPARIATLYRRAPLRRPVADHDKLWRMFESSTLVLTAWLEGSLVGIMRVMSDGAAFSLIADLAVEPDVQRLGVGRTLVKEVIDRCKGTTLMLLGEEISAGYYARMGFQKASNAWVLPV